MEFTTIIKDRMKENHVTPNVLAKEIGFTVQYIYKLLAGNKRWNETTMTRACSALNLKADFTAMEPTGPDAAANQ